MITNDILGSRDTWLWPLVFVAIIAALGLGDGVVRLALDYDRDAIAAGQWYRLLTANLVHLGWWHLFLNALGIVVLVLLCPEPLSGAVWLRRVVLIGTGMSLGLYFFVPATHWYVGASGMIHGFFVLGLGRQLMQRRDLIAAGCLAYLLGKIGWELATGVPVSDEQAIGGQVLVESHLYGSLTALLYGLIFGAFTGTEQFRRGRKPKPEEK